MPRPDVMRALYVNGWASGSHARMADLLRIADATEINTFIVDIKESDTYLSYGTTAIPLAREIGADRRPMTTWLPELMSTLEAHNIYPVARIVVFKDRMLADKRPDLAIRHARGGVWRDRKGLAWVNPYERRVWDYNIAIAQEALELGFREIQWDYVRFPDVTDSMRATMVFPSSNGQSREANIRDFIRYSKEKLKVPIQASVFGLSTHAEGDVEIGQQWEMLAASADALLPMVYPSHYRSGYYEFARPHAVPYELVRVALTDAVGRTQLLRGKGQAAVADVRPWLEAMSIRSRRYGPAEVRSQIQATYDTGLKSWALWNPGSSYEEYEAALRPADDTPSAIEKSGWKAPRWEPSPLLLSRVITGRPAPPAPPKRAD